MTRFGPHRARLADSQEHGADSELFLVEGDSALASVCAVRQERRQAVLAFQGKPLNAWHAGALRVDEHAAYQLLAQALGLAQASATQAAAELERLRYGRVLLLLDPDADGFHIGALLAMYFLRWQAPWVAAGRLWLVRAPMFEIIGADGVIQHADHPLERDALLAALRQSCPEAPPRVQAHRGLGSIRPAVLRERCLESATRRAQVLSPTDIQAMATAFSRAARGDA